MAVEGWGFLLPAQHRLSMLSVQPVCTAYLSSLSAQFIGTAYLHSLSVQPICPAYLPSLRAQLFVMPVCPAYLHSLSAQPICTAYLCTALKRMLSYSRHRLKDAYYNEAT